MPNLTLGNVRANGAIIHVAVGPSATQAKLLEQAGRPPVLPILIQALVDTGARSTYVDFTVASDLGLTPTGESEVNSVTSGPQPALALTYDVQLQLVGPGPPHLIAATNLRVVALDLREFGVRLLLGRDVLARCLLIYNGPSDQFTFSF
jgi:Aspartyl protease